MAKKNVIRPGAEVVPAAATVYCIGVEVLTASAGGHNMHPINRYRHGKQRRGLRCPCCISFTQ